LFGHEAGAFTGARGRKRGLLELAEGGTLLLNEIGELSLSLQSKLLAFLDTRAFLRVGGQESVHVHARLVAATHRDLSVEVREGRFLRPLLYRLDVLSIKVPPVRDRIEDIPVLVEEIMSALASELQLPTIPEVDPSDIGMLTRYRWPGNVRELRNVLERAVMLWEGERLDLHLPLQEKPEDDWSYRLRFHSGRTLRDVTDEVTRSLCEEALRATGGNKKEAAQLLGISRAALYRTMERLGLMSVDETLP
jgi:DNA-binding NtrC family response regulator